MPLKIQVLQHVSYEGPARIGDWAADRRHKLTTTKLFANETLPSVKDLDVLVVMGGPMGANDDARYSWMKGEKRLIAEAIEKGKKVLGVCLGAQLIARVLGAKVYANKEREIGWFPIELISSNIRRHPLNALPPKVTVFHWHGDTFELPKGAQQLAKSMACENQAFAVGDHVTGIQFHLEMTGAHIETLMRYAGEEPAGTYVQTPEDILDLIPSQVPPLNAALFRFLDGFTA